MAQGTPEFDPNDLEENIPDAHKIAMADLILAWARLDTMLTRLVCYSFQMNDDVGSIFIGKMDIKTKIERMKDIGAHMGIPNFAQNMETMSDNYRDHSQVRNAIAHNLLSGISKKDRNRLIFYPYKTLKKDKKRMAVSYYHIEHIKTATMFANDTAIDILTMLDMQEGPPQ